VKALPIADCRLPSEEEQSEMARNEGSVGNRQSKIGNQKSEIRAWKLY